MGDMQMMMSKLIYLRILLISCCASQLVVGASGVVADVDSIAFDCFQLFALLADNLSDLTEEDVQISNAFLNLSDFLLTLGNQGILEINVVLVGQVHLFLLLLEQLKLGLP